MDERVRDRRRFLPGGRGWRRGGLVLVAVLVVVAAVLFVWLRSSDVFAVRRITATATESVTRPQIAQATSSALGVSLLRISTKSVEAALLELPYVRSAEVYREFPNTLEIRLVEYRPVARLRGGDGSAWLLSDDGRILARADPPAGVSLPLVVPQTPVSAEVGKQAPDAVTAALQVVILQGPGEDEKAAGEGLPAIKEVGVAAGGQLSLRLAGGIELRLGAPTELEQKLKAAATAIQQALRDQEQVEYVDVSVPERAAVKAK